MYTLQYPTATAQFQQVEDRLRQLTLSFKTEQDSELDDIQLHDGSQLVQGFAQIQRHLDALQGELDQWYYCGC